MSFCIDKNGLDMYREQTVNDIIQLLSVYDKVACNRYTGFGKSYYIVPQLIKRLNSKVIIVVPSTPLLQQYKEYFKDNKDVQIITYQIIKNIETENILGLYAGFKYIICDECHHLGKNKWKKELNRFNSILKAKIIGLTATPVRGDSINVIESYFNNIQVEPLELIDGISLGFLPKIKYVVAYAEVEDKYDIRMNEIDRYKIENLLNVSNILKKHIGVENLQNNPKMLVYVPNIKYIDEAVEQCRKWFSEFEGYNINIYDIHSYKDIKENYEILDEFKVKHTDNTIDIMVSVDMITEGLHLPNISVEIMLRKTQSPVKYFQQLGRVINNKQPIVFDLINNSRHLYQMKKEYTLNILNSSIDRKKVMFDECIELYDETKDIQDILNKYTLVRLSNEEVDTLLLNNKEYIEQNPDKLSIVDMCKYFRISIDRFKSHIDRLGIKFEYDIGANQKRLSYLEIIKNNTHFIESNSNKMSIREICKILNVSRDSFIYALQLYNINFESVASNYQSKNDIYNIIKNNKNKIIEMMNNNMTLKQQCNELGIKNETTYRSGLIENRIEINWQWQKFEQKYDVDLYNEFVKLYKQDYKPNLIRQELGLDKLTYNHFRGRLNTKDQYRKYDKYGTNPLTDTDKQFIKDNFNKYSDKELSEILGKKRGQIYDYRKNHDLYPDNYIKAPKLTEIQKEQIKQLYLENVNISFLEIARRVGVSDKGVRGYLHRNKLYTPKPKKQPLDDVEVSSIVSDYASGKSKVYIESKYHIGHKTLNNILDNNLGVNHVKRHRQCAVFSYNEDTKKLIIQDYKSGLSKSKILSKYHLGYTKLQRILKEANN